MNTTPDGHPQAHPLINIASSHLPLHTRFRKMHPDSTSKNFRRGHKELDLFRCNSRRFGPNWAHPHPPSSFFVYLLSQQKSPSPCDPETTYLVGSVFGARSDTTARAIFICPRRRPSPLFPPALISP
ncbi:hypothetical protein BD779DRAFT_1565827 [Infundibulicybe gibba]|nr:hypothetical protein BD779DRAFT_1565827 [Infundibulicybe gibba]